MHLLRVVAFHKVRGPSTSLEELLQFFVLNTGEESWVADLVTIEVQDRQHRPVRNRVEEFIGLPGSRQRSCFRFAIADDARNDQAGVVKRRTKCMAERITEFSSFVNRPRRSRCDMAGNATRKGELCEKLF